jgi:hypothetical protein
MLDVGRPHAGPIKFRFNKLNSARNARYRVNRAGSAAARLNQADIVFIFSIRLEPTKTLQGAG